MWADKRFKEPWLLNFLQIDSEVPKKRVQGLHILKKICGPRADGSEVKFVTDGKLSIHGVFTEQAIQDFYRSNHKSEEEMEEEVTKEWDKCLILVKKYSINHVLHESVFGCRFELVVESFSFWVSEEGFRLKEDPEYCMDIECLRKKSQKLWEIWRQHLPDTTDTKSMEGSGQLSQLLAELAKDSQASSQIESLQNFAGPSQANNENCHIHDSDKEEECGQDCELDEGEEVFQQLSMPMMDVRRFLINSKDKAAIDNIEEWQVGFCAPVSQTPQLAGSVQVHSCNELGDKNNINISGKEVVVPIQKSSTGQDENNPKNCNMSVQVGESLLLNNLEKVIAPLKTNEQCAQVGDSLLAKSQDMAEESKHEEIQEIIELPANIIFHPVFLPDSQPQDKAESFHSNFQQESENTKGQIGGDCVASTQKPGNKDIPVPNFPISPVGIPLSQDMNQQKTESENTKGQIGDDCVASTQKPGNKDIPVPNFPISPVGIPLSQDMNQQKTDDGSRTENAYMTGQICDGFVASTQIPSNKDIPVPHFPISPVGLPVSQSIDQQKTGVQVRSFVTQTTPPALVDGRSGYHTAQQQDIELPDVSDPSLRKEDKATDSNTNKDCIQEKSVLLSQDHKTSLMSPEEYKTCLVSPQNQNEESNINRGITGSQLDNDERTVLSGLGQKIPSSGESSSLNILHPQNISSIESNEQNRLDNLYKNTIENLEQRNNTGYVNEIMLSNLSYDDNRVKKEKMEKESSVTTGISRQDKVSVENKENVRITSISEGGVKSYKMPNKSSDNVSNDILLSETNSDETNSSPEITTKRSTKLKRKTHCDMDEWEPSPPKAGEKQPKNPRQKSAPKTRFSFSKSKSVAENIQGMLSSEKKTKHDSSVLFGTAAGKLSHGKKKRLSTRKKLYSDNMLLCDVTSLSDTRSTLPSVSEEQELVEESDAVFVKQESESSETCTVCIEIGSLHKVNQTDNIDTINIKTEPEIFESSSNVENNVDQDEPINGQLVKNKHNGEVCSPGEENIQDEHNMYDDVLRNQPVVLLSPLFTGKSGKGFTVRILNANSNSTNVASQKDDPKKRDEPSVNKVANMIPNSDSADNPMERYKVTSEQDTCQNVIQNMNVANPISNTEPRTINSDISTVHLKLHNTEHTPAEKFITSPSEIVKSYIAENSPSKSASCVNTPNVITISPVSCVNNPSVITISPVSSDHNDSSTSYGEKLQTFEKISPTIHYGGVIQPSPEANVSKESQVSCRANNKIEPSQLVNNNSELKAAMRHKNNEPNEIINNKSSSTLNLCDTVGNKSSNGISFLNNDSPQIIKSIKDNVAHSELVDSIKSEDFSELHSELPPTGEFTKGFISSLNLQSSLQCAQRQHATPSESSREISDSQQQIDRIPCSNEILNLEEEDPDEEILIRVQKMLDNEREIEDNYNLLHIELKDMTSKAVHAYFIDT